MKLLLSLLLAAAAFGQQNTVFRRNVFDAVSAPQASAPLPNIGQAVHIVTVLFPSAVADVSGFVLRVEASFEGSTWFAISEDVTSAYYDGSFAYAITRCNGVYPYVRLRLVTAAADALTAHYTGSMQPIGIVRFQNNRYLLDSPLLGASVEGLHQRIGNSYYYLYRRMTPIVTANWTDINFDAGTTRTNNTGNIGLQLETTSTLNSWKLLCTTLPAAPYTVRLHIGYGAGPTLAAPIAFAMRESSTGSFIVYGTTSGASNAQWMVQKWTNPTTSSGGIVGQLAANISYPVMSVTFQDDNTYRYYFHWDGQQNYLQYAAANATWYTRVLRNDFIVPDQACAAIRRTDGNYAAHLQLLGYDVNPTW